MALDFPNAPTVGQLYPLAPPAGTPQWRWTGSLWESAGISMAGAVRYDGIQTLAQAEQARARQNIMAPPISAMGWGGIQTNGAMEVAQGSTAGTAYPVGASSALYPCDEWAAMKGPNGSVSTYWFASAGPLQGLNNFIGIIALTSFPSPTATDLAGFRHYVEAYKWARLGWGYANAQPITLGFWVFIESGPAGKIPLAIRNFNGTRSYVTTITINNPNTWEYKTVTIPGDATGSGWNVYGNVGAATITICPLVGSTYNAPTLDQWINGNYLGHASFNNLFVSGQPIFYITGVSIHPGIEAPTSQQSPYMFRHYPEELRNCQRYYEIGNAPGSYRSGPSGLVAAYDSLPFKAFKRIVPNMAYASDWQYYSGGGGAPCTVAGWLVTQDRHAWSASGLTNWNGWVAGSWIANARMT